MDNESIREIIRAWLLDAGITENNDYYEIAFDYYNTNNEMPTLGYVVAKYLADNEMRDFQNSAENNAEGESDSTDTDTESDEEPISITRQSTQNRLPRNLMMGVMESINTIMHSTPLSASNMSIVGYIESLQDMPVHVDADDLPNLEENVVNHDMIDAKRVLNEAEIDKLKLIVVNAENKTNYEMCSICFDEFVDTEILRILPCNHVYHRDCIDIQLSTESHKCPLCKSPCGEGKIINA